MHDIQLDPQRPEFHRAHIQVDPHAGQFFVATSTGEQRSSRLLSMCGANALLKLPTAKNVNTDSIKKGEWVDTILIGKL